VSPPSPAWRPSPYAERQKILSSAQASPVLFSRCSSKAEVWFVGWFETWSYGLAFLWPEDEDQAVISPAFTGHTRFPPETKPELASKEGPNKLSLGSMKPAQLFPTVSHSLPAAWLAGTIINELDQSLFCSKATRGHLEMIFKASSMSWTVSK
jgi:hypothetical protein